MKTKFLFNAALAAGMLSAFTFTSCKHDDPVNNCPSEKTTGKAKAEVPMNLIVSIDNGSDTRSFAEKASWTNGDKLGLFILNPNDENAFTGSQLNTPFTFGATGWSGATIGIAATLPRVCAYYPHDAAKGKFKEIAFDVNTDLLYSTPVSPVFNGTSADVRMTMKHALTQFKFVMSKNGYNGTAQVTSLKIVKKSGSMFTGGKMNLLTGAFTGVGEVSEFAYTPNVPISSNTVYGAAVVPAKGNFELRLVVDGRNYTCDLGQADWQAGKRYTYTFSISDTKLTIGDGTGGDKGQSIKIEPWSDNGNKTINLKPIA